MINTSKLTEELKAAGIPVSGCNSNGVVWDVDGKTEIQARSDVVAVLGIHDPTPEPEAAEFVFDKPIKAPDFIVASPKPKTNPKEALIEALGEARKPHGESKSIALIVLDLIEYINDLEKRVDTLEKKK